MNFDKLELDSYLLKRIRIAEKKQLETTDPKIKEYWQGAINTCYQIRLDFGLIQWSSHHFSFQNDMSAQDFGKNEIYLDINGNIIDKKPKIIGKAQMEVTKVENGCMKELTIKPIPEQS